MAGSALTHKSMRFIQIVQNILHAYQIPFKNFSALSTSNGNQHFFILKVLVDNVHSKSSDQKVPISDYQSQFSMSKIIRIFLNFFFIEVVFQWTQQIEVLPDRTGPVLMDQDQTFQKKTVMKCCKKQILTILYAHVWFLFESLLLSF